MGTNGNQWEAMVTNSNQWGTNRKKFVINGSLMAYYWEYSSGTYFHSVLMRVPFHITGNI